jgi:hypothetical protein
MILLTVLLINQTAVAADTKENGLRGIWLEGSYNPHHRTPDAGTGAGGAIGIRGEHIGARLGYVDNEEFDQNRISIIPAAFARFPTVNQGYKRVGPTWGFDFDFYLNPLQCLSLYAGPGIYYSGREEIIRETYGDGSLSTNAFGGNKKQDYVPTGSGGVQLIAGHLLIGAGYHSLRGYTVSIGGMW